MPQSIIPLVTKIDTSTPLDVSNDQAQTTLEEILEISERVHKQLEQVTGLELEKGDI